MKKKTNEILLFFSGENSVAIFRAEFINKYMFPIIDFQQKFKHDIYILHKHFFYITRLPSKLSEWRTTEASTFNVFWLLSYINNLLGITISSTALSAITYITFQRGFRKCTHYNCIAIIYFC